MKLPGYQFRKSGTAAGQAPGPHSPSLKLCAERSRHHVPGRATSSQSPSHLLVNSQVKLGPQLSPTALECEGSIILQVPGQRRHVKGAETKPQTTRAKTCFLRSRCLQSSALGTEFSARRDHFPVVPARSPSNGMYY